jgi:hypothetical protein
LWDTQLSLSVVFYRLIKCRLNSPNRRESIELEKLERCM